MMKFPKTPTKKKRKTHPASILQAKEDRSCLICRLKGRDPAYGVHQHHAFGGPNREKSEQYGLKAWACFECHEGNSGVHRDRDTDLMFKEYAQQIFEEKYGHELFMAEFGRNYL